ncbi:MAG: T9SS type A sorting domain-containing protein [Chitinophagales bacterium]
MKKLIFTPLLLGVIINVSAQKDCSHDHTGLIPITDLGTEFYRGFMGGLYPDGTSNRPSDHQTACIEHVQQIQPLDYDGNYDEDGKIVMLSIGASNPSSEFDKFSTFSFYYPGLNDKLAFVNGCVGGYGIQEMVPGGDYVNSLLDGLLYNGYSAEQVQICWLEEENTQEGDTAFPSASLNLVGDFLNLLTLVKTLFPNVKICYLSARAYSGYADPVDLTIDNGLEFPRDYMNGWTIKWVIENIINHVPGYEYDGPSATIPLATWGTYHWTDGSTPRADGLFLDCATDVTEDGLHLTGPGEIKIGQLMYNYFLSDTTAKYWYFKEGYNGINDEQNGNAALNIFPNPVDGNTLNIECEGLVNTGDFNINIRSMDGKIVYAATKKNSGNLSVELPEIINGIYLLTVESQHQLMNSTFVIAN